MSQQRFYSICGIFLLHILFIILVPSSLFALTQNEFSQVQTELKSEESSEKRRKLILLLIQHASQKNKTFDEIVYRKQLEEEISQKDSASELRLYNLFSLGKLYQRSENLQEALHFFKQVQSGLPKSHHPLQIHVLKALVAVQKQLNNPELEEAYLSKWATDFPPEDYEQEHKLFIYLTNIAQTNTSVNLEGYFDLWYQRALSKGTSAHQAHLLKKWVRFWIEENRGGDRPFQLLINLFEQEENPSELSQARLLYARFTQNKSQANQQYRLIFQENKKNNQPIPMEVLTYLLTLYFQEEGLPKGNLELAKDILNEAAIQIKDPKERINFLFGWLAKVEESGNQGGPAFRGGFRKARLQQVEIALRDLIENEFSTQTSTTKAQRPEGGPEGLRFINLYQRGVLYYRAKQSKQAEQAFLQLLKILPLAQNEIRNYTYQHLHKIYLREATWKAGRHPEKFNLAEKYLANYVLGASQSEDYRFTAGGLEQLIFYASQSGSKKEHDYYQNWYAVAQQSATLKEQEKVLIRWIDFSSHKPENFKNRPYEIAITFYEEQQQWDKLKQTRLLYAEKTQTEGPEDKAIAIYISILQQNELQNIPTQLGILTRLYQYYQNQKDLQEKQKILTILSQREDYEEKNQALKELAQISIQNEDWLTALHIHQKLIAREPPDKSQEGVTLLDNLIQISQKISREDLTYQYLDNKVFSSSHFISEEEQYHAFVLYMENRIKSREYKAAMVFYKKAVSESRLGTNSSKRYQLHFYGGRILESESNVEMAIQLYQEAIAAIPENQADRLQISLSTESKIFQLVELSNPGETEITVLLRILALQQQLKQVASMANTELLIAQKQEKLEHQKEASQYYKLALTHYQEVGNAKKTQELLTLLASQEGGSPQLKIQRLKELEQVQEQSGDTKNLIITRLNLGDLNRHSQQWEVAYQYYKKAVQTGKEGLIPERLRGWYLAGNVMFKLGKMEETISDLKNAENLYDTAQFHDAPSSEITNILAQVYQLEAKVYSHQKKFTEAEIQLQKALQLQNTSHQFTLQMDLAILWVQTAQNEKAENLILSVLSEANQEEKLEAMLLLIRSFLGRESVKEALTQLDEAETLVEHPETDPEILKILELRSQAYERGNDLEQSIQTQKKRVQLAQEQAAQSVFLSALLQLTRLQLQAGRLANAEETNQQFKPYLSKASSKQRWRHWLIGAELYQKQGKPEEALNLFAKIEAELPTDQEPALNAEFHYSRGSAYLKLLRFEPASKDFLESEKIYRQSNQIPQALQSLLAQANTKIQQGKLDVAEQNLLKLEKEALSHPNIVGDVYSSFAILYSESGQYVKALADSEKAEQAYIQAGQQAQVTEILNTRGLIFLKLKDFNQAEIVFFQALEQNKTLNNPLLDTQIFNNLGGLYQSRGQLEKASKQLLEAAELQKKLGFESELALTFNNIAVVNLAGKKFTESLEYLKQARTYANKFGLKKELAQSWNNEGIVHFRQNNLDKATNAFEEARQLQTELGFQLDLARTLNNLAMIASQEKQIVKALKLVQDGIVALSLRPLKTDVIYPNPELDAILAPDMMKTFLQNKGSFLTIISQENTGDEKFKFLEAARRSFVRSLDLVETIRAQIKAEESQQMLFEENINVFQQLISILYDLGEKFPEKDYHNQAFFYAEMSRARTFLDQIQEQAARASLKLPPEIAEKENRLKSKIALTDKNIFAEMSKSPKKRNISQIEQWQREKNVLQIEFRNLTKQLEEQYPAYASLKYPKVFQVKDVQQELLGQKSKMLIFFLGDDRSFGWDIGISNFKMIVLPPAGDIDQLVRKYRQTLVNPIVFPDEDDEDIIVDTTKTHLAVGLQLYRKLFAPLLQEDENSPIDTLLIIPDGVIYYLPIEAVIRQIHPKDHPVFPEGREYMLHKYSIVYSPSASVTGAILKQQKSRDPELMAKRIDFLGFGDPEFAPSRKQKKTFKKDPVFKRQGFYDLDRLYNTVSELKNIAERFPNSQITFFREEALESNVKKYISNAKYIHFATHGILDEVNPEYSGVVMNIIQPDAPEDGFLQTSEIFDLNLNADLVTLSACETGLGKVVKGEGMVGLTRSFLFAGTPSIVVALWTVADESTSKLMIHFYQFLQEGHDKGSALRLAKLALMKDISESTDEPFLDPFYWGPFILNGTQ